MAAIKKTEELQLNDNIKESKRGEAILGQLYGPVADIVNPTRNGRKYDESLWEKVFNDPIVNEYFESGGLLGELNHPADRVETDLSQVAVCMPEKPRRDKDGHLVATLDILDTPNGRIVYTLAKYGYKLGISSRGDGDVYEGYDGQEHVNEDTYRLEAWDIVLLPAVKAARLKMVESLQNGKTFKQAINEQLDKANADEKKIMTETLDKLNIEYNRENVIDKNNTAASDAGANIVKDLQESLLTNQKLEAQITDLQEKLSVCYAKEAKYDEDIAKYKTAIRNLSEKASNVNALQSKITSLTEQLDKQNLAKEAEVNKVNALLTEQKTNEDKTSKLRISLNEKINLLESANKEIKNLNEELESTKKLAEEKENKLNESIAEIKKNLTIKTNNYTNKLTASNKLVEKYRTTAKLAVDRYIQLQATMLGASANEIKNKLPENYSFDDIDSICENFRDFKLRVNKLPIGLQQKNVKVSINESRDPIIPVSRVDDSVDDSLLKLAKLK